MDLEYTHAREHLNAIREAALRAADPYQAIRAHVKLEDSTLFVRERTFDLKSTSRVLVAGAGKAGAGMATALMEIFGPRMVAGVVAIPRGHDASIPVSRIPPKRRTAGSRNPASGSIILVRAGHPLPNLGSLEAGERIRNLLEGAQASDLVVAPISGGGSALLELPRPGLSLAALRGTNELLLRSGATVEEINVIRQALSEIKGGGLTRMACPARVVGLILSDIVGDPLHLIASGPTVPSEGYAGMGLEIAAQYGLLSELPRSVLACLASPEPAIQSACPKPYNVLVGSNRQALGAAAAEAARLGFEVEISPRPLVGEARAAGQSVGRALRARRGRSGGPVGLIWGGETTVTVTGGGKGGRNQEVALAAGLEVAGLHDVVILACGTDGIDGPTDAAGAIVTGETVALGTSLGLSAQRALERHDVYPFLQAVGALLITGPTGTNVNDLTVGLVYRGLQK